MWHFQDHDTTSQLRDALYMLLFSRSFWEFALLRCFRPGCRSPTLFFSGLIVCLISENCICIFIYLFFHFNFIVCRKLIFLLLCLIFHTLLSKNVVKKKLRKSSFVCFDKTSNATNKKHAGRWSRRWWSKWWWWWKRRRRNYNQKWWRKNFNYKLISYLILLLHKRVFQFNSNFQLKLNEKTFNWSELIQIYDSYTHMERSDALSQASCPSVAKRSWLCCASMCVTLPYELSAFTWGKGEVTFSFTFPKRFIIIRRSLGWVNEGAGVRVREPAGVGDGDNKVVDVFFHELSWRHS